MFNDLIEKLTQELFQTYAYADDLATIGKGRKKIEEAIKIVEVWTRENNMIINKKKSGIIIHKNKRTKVKKK